MFSLEGGHAAAARLIARGVTGIVCASDPLALGAIRAARRAGLSVPADLSVVGYDDSAFMSCTDPPLTTVRQPIEAIGRAAVEMLAGPDRGLGRLGRGALLRARDRRPRLDRGRPVAVATPRSARAGRRSGPCARGNCKYVENMQDFVRLLHSIVECVMLAA